MAEKNGKEFIGIITERDLTQKVVGKGLDPKTRPVTETMSSPLITLDVEQPVTEPTSSWRNIKSATSP